MKKHLYIFLVMLCPFFVFSQTIEITLGGNLLLTGTSHIQHAGVGPFVFNATSGETYFFQQGGQNKAHRMPQNL